MANGDLAAAAGIFTPVLSSADIKLGYDDINRLADALAKETRSSWVSLAPAAAATAGFIVQTNYSLPAGTPVQYSKQGFDVAITLSLTRTTALAAGTAGDVGNHDVLQLPPLLTPAVSNGVLTSMAAGALKTGYVSSAGMVRIANSFAAIAAGEALDLTVAYHL